MDEKFMREKPVLPLILSMALPMVISMLVNSLYNIVDSFFVARISEDAMTALSLVYPVQNFINAAGIGFGIGINAAISFYLGAGDGEKANTAAVRGLFLTVIHGIVLTVVCIMIMPFFSGSVHRGRKRGFNGDTLLQHCVSVHRCDSNRRILRKDISGDGQNESDDGGSDGGLYRQYYS